MKIGFIIICRYNSLRLPGKILKEINGKPILQFIIDHLSQIIPLDNIVVATSDQETDQPIVNYCNNKGINCFRGSLNNVSERFLKCAKHYAFHYAVRINGDNVFIDKNTIQEMYKIACKDEYDFISNVKNRTFPKGMSVEMVRVKYYEQEFNKFEKPEHFEHVTIKLYENDTLKNHYYYFNTEIREAGAIQLAVDTEEDFTQAGQIINELLFKNLEFNLKNIFNIYKQIQTNAG